MSLSGKVWGETRLLWKTPFVEVHLLDVLPHAHCSMHHHARKWNAFLLIDGELTIEVEKVEYGLTDRTVLRGRGAFTTVRPGEVHRFVAGASAASVLEIYCPDALSEDIVRRDCGGLLPVGENPPELIHHPV